MSHKMVDMVRQVSQYNPKRQTLDLIMQLTNPELEILKLLWKEQPLTAKEIHTQLSGTVNWSYSSTRKTLERMGEKKLVSISLQENKNIYATKVSKVATLAKFAQDFAKRVLEIDGPIPAAMFTGSQILEKEEVEELEQLLNNAKRKKQSQ